MSGSTGGADRIVIRGAAEHNLRSVDLTLPKRKLIVFSGISGSGKSSLAFDTIYTEGRRRYVESLSSYARQFLGRMEKPRYDRISGLAPTIAIEQKKAASNPRSTVGTVTEIHDYLRVFFANVAEQHCPRCGRQAGRTSPEEIIAAVLERYSGERVAVLAPLAEERKGGFREMFEALVRQGFLRVRVNGKMERLDGLELDGRRKHTVELVVDRLKVGDSDRSRLAEAVETALEMGDGWVRILHGERTETFSTARACPDCGIGLPEPTPQLFSFNSPIGMCRRCEGLGRKMEVDPDKVVPDPSLSILEGAVAPWRSLLSGNGWGAANIYALAEALRFSLETPWKDLPERVRRIILYGSSEPLPLKVYSRRGVWVDRRPVEGIVRRIERLYHETASDDSRNHYLSYMSESPCPACGGARLRPEALAFKADGRSIADVERMSVRDARAFFRSLSLEGNRAVVGGELVKEIDARLSFLLDVGLGYMTLDRPAATLSGGEAQRIRLASQLGAELSGVIYVLDEPSIGLHPRDNGRLLATLRRLRDLGNTVIVVEHDRETIESADHVVEFGPGAGREGGRIVYSGDVEGLKRAGTLTSDYLTGAREIPVPERRRDAGGKRLVLRGCRRNNLKGIDVEFPLGTFVAVTGVSGAGKSSLVNETLLPALRAVLQGKGIPGRFLDAVEGAEHVDKVIEIDQEPIGRTPRSNPATYTKVFDHIRAVFASTREAAVRGYAPGRFSFNVRGGRCEACQGNGYVKVEMHFLPDVYVPCEVCRGRRFNRETLQVKHRGKDIAEVLDMTVDEAFEHFEPYRAIRRILSTLQRVGLGYLKLGQPSPTLSGGEAQRIKLSRELARPATGNTLYVLDEPTTGLHFENVRMLVEVLQELVDRGNTVVVIEHNLDVIKCADHVIDLGPEGGDEGGRVTVFGTPEEVARAPGSYTGRWLARLLERTAAGAF